MLKALFILILSVAVFGSGAYWTYELFLKPHQELREESNLPPEAAPPDSALPEFERCVALEKERKVVEARTAFERFLEQNPQSSKAEEARAHLGELNTVVFLSPLRTPEKQEYVVRSGDVLNKVALKMKTTPELLLRANRLLAGSFLHPGQHLLVASGEFSLVVNKRSQKLTVLNHGKFFKDYPIRSMAAHKATPVLKKAGTVPLQKIASKVSEKIAWSAAGQRVSLAEKDYSDASHWIGLGVPGNTLYSDPGPESAIKPPHPPGGGLGMAPAHMEELAALLRKGDPVSIEQ